VYLKEEHGEDWQASLQAHKLAVAQGRLPTLGKCTRGDFKGVKDQASNHASSKLAKDVSTGTDAILRFLDADWWTWKRGSALFFWQWPAGEQRKSARDGMPIWIRSRLPRYQRASKKPDPTKKHLILAKLHKIFDRGYVVAPDMVNFIRSLMNFFEEAKESDIRLVYNGTSCGLNDTLWAQHFWLPTPSTAARTLGYGYFMVDIDLGEMFLNFPLHKMLQKFSVVDFSQYSSSLREPLTGPCKKDWVHWTRCWMGLLILPARLSSHTCRFHVFSHAMQDRTLATRLITLSLTNHCSVGIT
jgi:hypothetical protein